MYVCPICKSGTGKNSTGALSIKNNRVTCFSGNCFSENGKASTDTLGALIKIEGLTETDILKKYTAFVYQELRRATEWHISAIKASKTTKWKNSLPEDKNAIQGSSEAKVEKQDYTPYLFQVKEKLNDSSFCDRDVTLPLDSYTSPIKTPKATKWTNSLPEDKNAIQGNSEAKLDKRDYTPYFFQVREKLKLTPEAMEYLTGRGLTEKNIDRFLLGYDPNWKHPDSPTMRSSQRLIIPTSKSSYTARAIDKNINRAYKAMKVGNISLFNIKDLYKTTSKTVFITEGEIDALSVIEAGAQAVALGSTTSYGKLIAQIKKEPTNKIIILSLDNDKSGQEATKKIEEELQKISVIYIKSNISGENKDPNEALIKDKKIFFQAVEEAKIKAKQYAKDIEKIKETSAQIEREKYINETSVTAFIEGFCTDIKKSLSNPAIPTNFEELDEILDGGLYEGLYILGAISSLGKTSFVLQIADQVAQQGQDVLIFSLEMAKTELMAKSISRISFLECNGVTSHAKTTRGITSGKQHINYSIEEKALINDAIMKYSSYTNHLYIYEGVGNIGVIQIRETVEKHI
jgi:replicative DNA helicase